MKPIRNLHKLTGATDTAIRNLETRKCARHPNRDATHAVHVWHGVKPACDDCAKQAKSLNYPVSPLSSANKSG